MDMKSMPVSTRPSVMGVFAHPDDEVFCAGGALAQFADAGCQTMVLSATKGEAGQIQDAPAATRATLGAVRERELRIACRHLGVRDVICLDYRDGMLIEVDQTDLVDEIAAYISAFDPDIVITFGPDGGSGHPDHIAISNATTRACQRIACEDGRAPSLYYSVFPRQHKMINHHLAHWLAASETPFAGSPTFVRALALLAEEAVLMGYADDALDVQWYPAGFSIVEQGEAATGLYLIISGHAEVIHEETDGVRHVSQLGPGDFFGADAMAQQRLHGASLVATETTTCLTLSTTAATAFDGRGGNTQLSTVAPVSLVDEGYKAVEHTQMDVTRHVDRKVAALAAHRTQFLTEPDMLPSSLWTELFGVEYFTPVRLSAVGDWVAAAQSQALPA